MGKIKEHYHDEIIAAQRDTLVDESEADEYCTCEMPAKMHGKNKCWRCKKPFKEF